MEAIALGAVIFSLGITLLTVFLGPPLLAIVGAIIFVGFCVLWSRS